MTTLVWKQFLVYCQCQNSIQLLSQVSAKTITNFQLAILTTSTSEFENGSEANPHPAHVQQQIGHLVEVQQAEIIQQLSKYQRERIELKQQQLDKISRLQKNHSQTQQLQLQQFLSSPLSTTPLNIEEQDNISEQQSLPQLFTDNMSIHTLYNQSDDIPFSHEPDLQALDNDIYTPFNPDNNGMMLDLQYYAAESTSTTTTISNQNYIILSSDETSEDDIIEQGDNEWYKIML
jgi:hypothetical protein